MTTKNHDESLLSINHKTLPSFRQSSESLHYMVKLQISHEEASHMTKYRSLEGICMISTFYAKAKNYAK